MIAYHLEKYYPGLFEIEMRQDQETTGRLDLTLYFNRSADGILVHSKRMGHGYPIADKRMFDERLKTAIKPYL